MKRRVLTKTTPFHALFTKKTLNCAVLNGTIIFFPWTRREQGTKIFFSPLFVTDFPPPDDFKKTLTQPTSNVLKGWWRGGSAVAALATSPSPVFAYKNRGRGRKKRRTERERRGIEGREKWTAGREKREDWKKKKNRRRRREENKKQRRKREREKK